MRVIINQIAQDYALRPDWLNDGVKGFMTNKMNTTDALTYSNLQISSIDAEGLLAMKLISAREQSKTWKTAYF